MDTASFPFLLFGLAAAIISNFSRSPVWRSIVLFFASLFLIGLLSHDPVALIPLLVFLLLGYAFLIILQRGWVRSTAWSILAVVTAYIWLKKYTFLPEGSFLQFPYFTLGLSYIFFRVLHLLIEAGDESGRRHIGLGAYLLYTLNFTTFVSGPIQRYDEFARDQFTAEPPPLNARIVGMQLERIVRGFFKVNVLAMLLQAYQTDATLQVSEALPPILRCFAAVRLFLLYPLFLYCNFSGYIDVVIAIARLMRIRLPENFNRPFNAASVMDFWNQWHITLSTWFKTYVYNPLLLALMRRISSQTVEPLLGVFCFFVTFFLVGIWHGRTSEFIVFGFLTGSGISINKLWQIGLTKYLGRKGYKSLAKNSVYVALGRGLTFSWFGFTLFWFWADWERIHKVFEALSVAQWAGVFAAMWLSATMALALWEVLRSALLSLGGTEKPLLTSRYARVVYVSAMGMIAILITVMLSQPAPGIVYKAF